MKEEEAGADTNSITLIDATNGFNELSRIAMLWTVRHQWPTGARFTFNCYWHKALIVFRRPAALFHIVTSREGVTQGDPLLMVLYGLPLLPLSKSMRTEDPGIFQPWYADDAGMRGLAWRNAKLLQVLMGKGPYHCYSPEPEKI